MTIKETRALEQMVCEKLGIEAQHNCQWNPDRVTICTEVKSKCPAGRQHETCKKYLVTYPAVAREPAACKLVKEKLQEREITFGTEHVWSYLPRWFASIRHETRRTTRVNADTEELALAIAVDATF